MCSPRDPCGGLLYADERFNRDAEREGVNVRRVQCANSHSFILGPPPAARGHIPTPPTAKLCKHCGEPITAAEPHADRRTKHVRCMAPEVQKRVRREMR